MRRKGLFQMDLLIFSILDRKDCYGYEIAAIIEKESKGNIELKEGVMYPILHRLLEDGMISEYEERVGRKVRVYYHLEESGRIEYQKQKKDFFTNFEYIANIIKNSDSK